MTAPAEGQRTFLTALREALETQPALIPTRMANLVSLVRNDSDLETSLILAPYAARLRSESRNVLAVAEHARQFELAHWIGMVYDPSVTDVHLRTEIHFGLVGRTSFPITS